MQKIFVSLAVVLSALPLFAQPPGRPPEPPLQFDLRLSHQFESDLDAGGDFSLDEQTAGLEFTVAETETDRLSASLTIQRMDFNFHDASAVVPGLSSPFETVWKQEASLNWKHQINDRWESRLQLQVTDAREEGADSGVTGGGYGALSYEWSDRVSVGAAMLVRSRIEDDLRVLPLPFLVVRFNDQWMLRTQRGVLVTYTTEDRKTKVTAAAEYLSSRFRIDGGTAVPDGVAEYTRIPLSLEVKRNLNKQFFVSGGIAAVFGQSFDIDNANGNTVRKDLDSDPALRLTLQAGVMF